MLAKCINDGSVVGITKGNFYQVTNDDDPIYVGIINDDKKESFYKKRHFHLLVTE